MKVLHFSLVRKISSGQLKQLQWEKAAGKELGNWNTLVYHAFPSIDDTVKQIPWPFRSIFLRGLFAWYVIWREHKKYDFVLIRHMPFDIYSVLFSWLIDNRVTVHHSKEVSELRLIREGWKGKLASVIEDKVGGALLKRNKAILGVTGEIAEYEVGRTGLNIPSFIYPNGISYSDVAVLSDNRDKKVCNVFFMCGKFSRWHGLDIVLNAVMKHKPLNSEKPIVLHLVGDLLSDQIVTIESNTFLANVCKVYGQANAEQYTEILSACDVGLGSFALFRKDLQEAATLKVREMLACGVPVISGHKDTGLADDFPFYQDVGTALDFNSLYDSYKVEKKYQRADVRQASKKYINKKDKMEDVIQFLSTLTKV